MGEKIGIRELAKMAGVSIGTIDRVINKRSGVSVSTREKVEKLIEQTGYERNIFASRLASRNGVKVACLLPEPSKEINYWQLHIQGVKDAAEELKHLDVQVDFYQFQLLNRVSYQTQLVALQTQEYNALITVPFYELDLRELVKGISNKNGLTVFLDTPSHAEGNCYFIYQAPYRAGQVAGRLLKSHFKNGNGHVLTVNISRGNEIQWNNLERARGIKDFFIQNKLEVTVEDFSSDLEDASFLEKHLQTFFQKNGAKAIFVTNARTFMVAEVIEQLQYNEPLKIVGFDLNKKNADHMNNGTIDYLINQKPYFQGRKALKRIYEYLILGEESETPEMMVPVEIVVKENLKDYIVV